MNKEQITIIITGIISIISVLALVALSFRTPQEKTQNTMDFTGIAEIIKAAQSQKNDTPPIEVIGGDKIIDSTEAKRARDNTGCCEDTIKLKD